MNWSRADLKSRGKAAFLKSYWWCVLAAVILSLVGSGNSRFELDKKDYQQIKEGGLSSLTDIAKGGAQDALLGGGFSEVFKQAIPTVAISGLILLIVFAFLLVLALSVGFGTFVSNPLRVGGCKYFLDNGSGEGAKIGNFLSAFKSGHYLNVVLIMFLRGLYTFLWSLLLVIPGIIKSYEYRMVPYLLAEYPEMSSDEVFRRSKEMMNGEKWNAFVLDLSFLGWIILAAITANLSGIFFSEPYQHATNAELYFALGGGRRYDTYTDSYGSQNDFYNSYN